jgi:cation:H+ antiporter
MNMMLAQFAVSLIFLYIGTESILRGINNLLRKNSTLWITLIVIASVVPRLSTGLVSGFQDIPGMAAGTILGSHIFTLCVIMGISSLVSPQSLRIAAGKYQIIVVILSALLFIFLFTNRQLGRTDGIVLFSTVIIYLFFSHFLFPKENKLIESSVRQSTGPKNSVLSLLFLFTGLIFLTAGGKLLYDASVGIHLGTTMTGLTIISAGAGLPFLIIITRSSFAKEDGIPMLLILNMLVINLLGAAGVMAMIRPVAALAISNIDLGVLFGTTLLLIPFFRTKYTLKREDGVFLILLYGIYLYYLWPK